jgi:uncharacterized protein YoxC
MSLTIIGRHIDTLTKTYLEITERNTKIEEKWHQLRREDFQIRETTIHTLRNEVDTLKTRLTQLEESMAKVGGKIDDIADMVKERNGSTRRRRSRRRWE